MREEGIKLANIFLFSTIYLMRIVTLSYVLDTYISAITDADETAIRGTMIYFTCDLMF